MEINTLLRFLAVAERLKCRTRHCDTSSGRRESVAEHSWRLALLAWLVRDEFPHLDIARVIELCLVHDLGEAITGDIPTFRKTDADEDVEALAQTELAKMLPAPASDALAARFAEIRAQETEEARLFLVLDKLEAVLQHNESDIASWLPLEYDLQLTHGAREAEFSDFTRRLKAALNEQTRQKIAESEKNKA